MAVAVWTAITLLFTAGWIYEESTRHKGLQVVGQNDITEEDCTKLCIALRTRWNELCLARSDEAYMRVRWQQAALAAAGAVAAAAALQIAANAAMASGVGALAGVALAAAALVALALAVAATGFMTHAWFGFQTAATAATGKQGEFQSARTQMTTTCGEDQMLACHNKLPPCP
jgi:hypothetical protein